MRAMNVGLAAMVAALSAIWLSVPANAQRAPDPGVPHEVHGIEPGARLILHAQPDDDAPVVGRLAGDARNVVVSGATVQTPTGLWYEIIREDGRWAWARADHLRAQAEREPSRNYTLMCTGTEPFWSLSIASGRATFSTPDLEQDVIWDASEWKQARGLLDRFAIRLDAANGSGYLAVIAGREACSDNMSDMAYPFETLLITPAQAVRGGCCRRSGD